MSDKDKDKDKADAKAAAERVNLTDRRAKWWF
jgi:hypothetical protein